jgi:hypothetical protein
MLILFKENSMKYLCEACCKILGISFNGDAVNEVGRKCCSKCGDNRDSTLHILGE